jgi:hypothetical protein
LNTTRGRSADASVNWMNFSASLHIVYHFSPELTLASGATALGSVRAQASLNQTDPTTTHYSSLVTHDFSLYPLVS